MEQKHQKNLLDLLPQLVLDYSRNDFVSMKSGFQALSMVINIAESALNKIITRDVLQFDGIVGNNNCRFVAFRNWWSFNDGSIYQEAEILLPIVSSLKKDCASFERSNNKKQKEVCSFGQFLRDSCFAKIISPAMYHSILLHGCYIAKVLEGETCWSDPDLLKAYAPENISVRILRKIVVKWQRTLSAELIDHALYKSGCLSIRHNSYYQQIIRKNIIKDSFQRACSPAFFDMRLIIDVFKRTSGAILALLVNIEGKNNACKRCLFVYRISSNSMEMIKEDEYQEMSESTPVFVIEGHSKCSYGELDRMCLKSVFCADVMMNFSLEEIVLANYARYPLYPGKGNQEITFSSIDLRGLTPSEKMRTRKVISEMEQLSGFSMADPAKFCVFHIFASTWSGLQVCVMKTPYNFPKCKSNA